MKYTMFAALLVAFSGPLLAQAAPELPPGIDPDQALRYTPTVRAFQQNKDAVVSISGKQLVREADPFFWFWGDDSPWGTRPRYQAAPFLGSGFVIDPRGYVVTNDHVVHGAVEVSVALPGRAEPLEATIIAEDAEADIALLRVDTDKPLAAVNLGLSDDLLIGEPVLAIGNPFGYQFTLTEGIVSAIHRDLEIENRRFGDLIQISAPINPGNSGGPLLNIYGRVIGMNTAIRKAAQGIGFAIPIDQIREDLPRMLRQRIETLDRIDLGFTAVDRDPCMPAEATAEPVRQVVVESVREGSAGAAAGLKPGQVIATVAGEPVSGALDLYLALLEAREGATITLGVQESQQAAARNARSRTVELTLAARPKPDARRLARNLFGLEVEAFREAAQGRFRDLGGVLVTQVEPDSPAHNAGIAPGDILVGVGNQDVTDIESLGYILEQVEPGAVIPLSLQRISERGWQIQIFRFERTLRAREAPADSRRYQL